MKCSAAWTFATFSWAKIVRTKRNDYATITDREGWRKRERERERERERVREANILTHTNRRTNKPPPKKTKKAKSLDQIPARTSRNSSTAVTAPIDPNSVL